MPRHRDDEPRHQDLNCAIYAVKDLHGNAVAIAGNDPMVYPQNGAGVTLTVKYSHMGSLDRLLAEALDEIEASVPDGFCATGCASLNVALPDGCFMPRPRLELRPRVDDDWETRYEAASPCHIRMDMARKTAMNAIDLMRRGYEDHGGMENAGSDTSKLGHLPVKHGLTEFVIPVTVTGVLTERVMADTFVQAQKKIQKKLHDANDLSSRKLHDMCVCCNSPLMSLSPEQRATWPYWAYGWYGTDGVDWRQYETDKGPRSIPELAEESWPIPMYGSEHNNDNAEKGDDNMEPRLDKNPEMDNSRMDSCSHDGEKTVIITAGPTNERIDAVMQITNMSTGSLGAKIAETMLNTDGKHDGTAAQISKIYYLSPKLARKPSVPDGQAYKLELVEITTAESLLEKMTEILTREHVDLVVHSCAVGDYTARYSARAEDLSAEIAKRILNTAFGKNAGQPMKRDAIAKAALEVLKDPACKANDETKMSSYEPNLMTMMGLTPKVISHVKELSPDTMLIGFKLLENVDKQTLFDVASRLRQKNNADYIIANDLAEIRNGKHPAMVVGYDHIMERDAIFAYCDTKQDIAEQICRMAFRGDEVLLPAPAPDNALYQVVATNSTDNGVQIAGFSADRAEAWRIMFRALASAACSLDAHDELKNLLRDVPRFDTDFPEWNWTSDDGRCSASISLSDAMICEDEHCWSYRIVAVDRSAILGVLTGDKTREG